MATFRDNSGREWQVAINTLQLKRVREATGFELAKLLDDEFSRLKIISKDPELLGKVLFALCAKQHAGITEEHLLESLAGDALEAAFDAFVRAFADFSPSHLRALLLAMVTKERELTEALAAKGTNQINAIDVAETLSGSAGGSAGSAASTPPG